MRTSISAFLLALLSTSISVLAQVNKEKLLYPQGIENNPVKHDHPESFADSIAHPNSLSHLNRVYSNVSVPTYTLYPAAGSVNKHIGVVIYPGGGFVNNWVDKEGTDIALWLSQKGITCLVLKYRTNRRDDKKQFLIPFDTYKSAIDMDSRAAVSTFKRLADSLKIDKDKIGVMGFSAGGWLAERVAVKSTNGTPDWKPAFAGLIYFGNKDEKTIEKVKNKNALPPFFMATARDDRKLSVNNIMPHLALILKEADKSELHIYAKGDHGFGLAYDNGSSVELWKDSFYRWLLDIYGLK